MSDQQLKPPRGLKAAGRRLWSAVAGQAQELGCRLDTLESEQLWNACRLRDGINDMEQRLAGADLMIPGSREQWVAHPLLVEIRLHRQLLSQTLARLRFPEEESGAPPVVSRSTAARAAANARWRGTAS